MCHVWRRREMHTEFWWETCRKEAVWVIYVLSDERIILQWILKKSGSA